MKKTGMMVTVFGGALGNLLLKVKLQNRNNFPVKHRAVFSISLLVSKGKVKTFRYDFWGDYLALLQYLWRIHSRIPTSPSFPTPPLLPPYQNPHMRMSLHVQWCRRVGVPHKVTDPTDKIGGRYFGQGT